MSSFPIRSHLESFLRGTIEDHTRSAVTNLITIECTDSREGLCITKSILNQHQDKGSIKYDVFDAARYAANLTMGGSSVHCPSQRLNRRFRNYVRGQLFNKIAELFDMKTTKEDLSMSELAWRLEEYDGDEKSRILLIPNIRALFDHALGLWSILMTLCRDIHFKKASALSLITIDVISVGDYQLLGWIPHTHYAVPVGNLNVETVEGKRFATEELLIGQHFDVDTHGQLTPITLLAKRVREYFLLRSFKPSLSNDLALVIITQAAEEAAIFITKELGDPSSRLIQMWCNIIVELGVTRMLARQPDKFVDMAKTVEDLKSTDMPLSILKDIDCRLLRFCHCETFKPLARDIFKDLQTDLADFCGPYSVPNLTSALDETAVLPSYDRDPLNHFLSTILELPMTTQITLIAAYLASISTPSLDARRYHELSNHLGGSQHQYLLDVDYQWREGIVKKAGQKSSISNSNNHLSGGFSLHRLGSLRALLLEILHIEERHLPCSVRSHIQDQARSSEMPLSRKMGDQPFNEAPFHHTLHQDMHQLINAGLLDILPSHGTLPEGHIFRNFGGFLDGHNYLSQALNRSSDIPFRQIGSSALFPLIDADPSGQKAVPVAMDRLEVYLQTDTGVAKGSHFGDHAASFDTPWLDDRDWNKDELRLMVPKKYMTVLLRECSHPAIRCASSSDSDLLGQYAY